MLLQRISRRAGAFKSLAESTSRTAQASWQQRRLQHNVPPLPHDDVFSTGGVPGLLSAEGYDIAWTQYMKMVVRRLNVITAGFPEEHAQPKAIVIQHARSPTTASLFNHASMAHNNQLFFETLSPKPKPLAEYRSLEDSLVKTFGSIDTLRKTMIDTAAAMFGPGYVWLVWASTPGARVLGQENRAGFRILTTYNAGTPYSEAGYRQQGLDLNNHSPGSAASAQARLQAQHNVVQNVAGSFGAASKAGQDASKYPPGAAFVEPVLCVNTWQHVYLTDFGVAGKREYLNRWWDAIDWDAVYARAPAEAKRTKLGSFQTS